MVDPSTLGISHREVSIADEPQNPLPVSWKYVGKRRPLPVMREHVTVVRRCSENRGLRNPGETQSRPLQAPSSQISSQRAAVSLCLTSSCL